MFLNKNGSITFSIGFWHYHGKKLAEIEMSFRFLIDFVCVSFSCLSFSRLMCLVQFSPFIKLDSDFHVPNFRGGSFQTFQKQRAESVCVCVL